MINYLFFQKNHVLPNHLWEVDSKDDEVPTEECEERKCI